MALEPSEGCWKSLGAKLSETPTRSHGRNPPLVPAPSEASSPRGIVSAEVPARGEKEQGPLPRGPDDSVGSSGWPVTRTATTVLMLIPRAGQRDASTREQSRH